MSNNFDKIEETLDVDVKTISKEYIKKVKKEISRPVGPDEAQSDYEYTRQNLYDLLEKGQEAIYEMLEIAKETQKARDFEVAGQLIKSVGDVSDKLLDLQHKMKKLKQEDPKLPNQTNVTNNALFVGSTADLQKFLKETMKDK
jgi:superfamily I DNA/RNA helicase